MKNLTVIMSIVIVGGLLSAASIKSTDDDTYRVFPRSYLSTRIQFASASSYWREMADWYGELDVSSTYMRSPLPGEREYAREIEEMDRRFLQMSEAESVEFVREALQRFGQMSFNQESHVPEKQGSSEAQIEASELCPVCYESPCDTNTVCKHSFCTTCLMKWIEKNNSCPLCRRNLVD